MPQAARMLDPQVCPDLDDTSPLHPWHVGGAILEGSPNVFINWRLAARCGDKTLCVPVARLDLLVTGAAKIHINGRLAAMVGSKIWHAGQVVVGSDDVIYGSEMAGATFGDAAAATAACLEAAKSRKKGQQQGKLKNCGHETVRQLCLQRCQQQGPGSKACDACKYNEDEWYRRYLNDQKIADLHNAESKQQRDTVRARNDEVWKAMKKHSSVKEDGETVDTDELPDSWEGHEGRKFVHKKKLYTVGRLPPRIEGDEKARSDLADRGQVGSQPATRAQMLKQWCGIDERSGKHSLFGVGDDLADGGTVSVNLDLSRLPSDEQVQNAKKAGTAVPRPSDPSEELHVVTVSQMQFDANGDLQEVTFNDTSEGGGCGRVLPGESFKHALIQRDNLQTNVVPNYQKPGGAK